MRNSGKLGSSFRDPSGFLFHQGGVLYRQINQTYSNQYNHLMDSGLYADLVQTGLLVAHQEISPGPVEAPDPEKAYKLIQPERLQFISYPYEWSFSQLQDAALTTLNILRRAIKFGMSLKDSSAFNIQFDVRTGKPILIDTLSFEVYQEGTPWTAYRQFCQHFLAPLALMAYKEVRLNQLTRTSIDGIPLELASKLLPLRTWLNFALVTHIHIHAAAQRRYAGQVIDTSQESGKMSKNSFLGLIDSLEGGVRRLRWEPEGTEWADYTSKHSYISEAFEDKKRIVVRFLERIQPQCVWDLGANIGTFSRLASKRGIPTVAFDIDPGAVEQNYLRCKQKGEQHLLPLIIDLTNPSPNLGWHHQERDSLLDRGPVETVMALAIIHHLAISNNVPLANVASFCADLSRWLIIEFVPKNDSQVQRLLASREDIFSEYTQAGFEEAFSEYFQIEASEPIEHTDRTLYLMKTVSPI